MREMEFWGRLKVGERKSVLFLLTLSLISTLAIYWEIVHSLVMNWLRSDDHNHGVLIPFVVIYLVWLKRDKLAALEFYPSILGLILFAGMVGILFVAQVLDINVVQQTGVVLLIPILILAFLGSRPFKALLFPLFFLVFATPIWELVAPALQEMSTHAAEVILQFFSIPVFVEGNYISVPEGRFLVAEACGGLRFFITACAIGTLYAYVNYSNFYKRAIFVLTAVVMGIVLNWVRVSIIIYIGHATNMNHPLVSDHYSLGWWLFVLGLIPLFYFGTRLGFDPPSPKNFSIPETSIADHLDRGRHFSRIWFYGGGVVFILLSAQLALTRMEGHDLHDNYQIAAPTVSAPWNRLEGGESGWHPIFQGAAKEVLTTYALGDQEIGYYSAKYAKQHQGAELISDLNQIFDESRWRLVDSRTRVVSVSGRGVKVNELELRDGSGQSRLLWYWYRVSGSDTSSNVFAKLLELKKIISSDKASMVFALEAEYDADADQARDILAEFLGMTYSQILHSSGF